MQKLFDEGLRLHIQETGWCIDTPPHLLPVQVPEPTSLFQRISRFLTGNQSYKTVSATKPPTLTEFLDIIHKYGPVINIANGIAQKKLSTYITFHTLIISGVTVNVKDTPHIILLDPDNTVIHSAAQKGDPDAIRLIAYAKSRNKDLNDLSHEEILQNGGARLVLRVEPALPYYRKMYDADIGESILQAVNPLYRTKYGNKPENE
jgi:hypothetical protein